MTILQPGYLRWDGTKYVTDPEVTITGPAGPPGLSGSAGPAGPAGPAGADGYGGGPATVIPFASSIVFDGENKRMIAPATAKPLAIGKSAGTPVDGSQRIVDIPVGPTQLILGAELNIRGPFLIADPTTSIVSAGFDPTKRHQIIMSVDGYTIVGSYIELADSDVTAPTLSSASIDTVGNPNILVCTYNEVCLAPDLTGISLPFTSGTARTITGIIDGYSNIHKYSLSGNVSFGDACKVVIGSSRTICDLSGNLVNTNGSGLSVNITGANTLALKAAWTRCFESNIQMSPSAGLPANFISWTDQIGGSLTFAPASSGNSQRTAAPNASLQFTTSTDQRVKVATSLGSGDWALFARLSSAVGQEWTCINFNTNGSDNVRINLLVEPDRISYESFNGAAEVVIDSALFSIVNDTIYNIAMDRVGTTVTVRVDGHSPTTGTDSSTTQFAAINNVTLGAETTAGGTPASVGAGKITDIAWKTGAGFVGSEVTDIFTYVNGR